MHFVVSENILKYSFKIIYIKMSYISWYDVFAAKTAAKSGNTRFWLLLHTCYDVSYWCRGTIFWQKARNGLMFLAVSKSHFLRKPELRGFDSTATICNYIHIISIISVLFSWGFVETSIPIFFLIFSAILADLPFLSLR